nr:DUF6325 family protein [Streptomyces sp. RKAG337]
MDEFNDLGPIDYLIIEFPNGDMGGEGLPLLVDLVDRGIIRIIDLSFVRKETDGSVVALTIADLDHDGVLELAVFEGAPSGLLSSEDVDEAGAVLEPGSAAGIIVYENLWAAPLASALRRSGAQMIAGGRIPLEDLVGALDAAGTGD